MLRLSSRSTNDKQRTTGDEKGIPVAFTMYEYLNIFCCFLPFYHKSGQWKQSICIILWALNYFAIMQQYSLMLALQFSLFLIQYEYLEGMGSTRDHILGLHSKYR